MTTYLITGASSGLGLATARALTGHVILAVRDAAKGRAAQAQLRNASSEVRLVDLADLDSVRAFAATLDRVDVLINNAGVMAPPHTLSAQGHELQFAVNHLAHFALTALLLDRLTARVVTVSSVLHRKGRLDLARLHRPSSELHREDRPTSELHHGDRPSSELHRDDRPTSELHHGDRPTSELHRDGQLDSSELHRDDRRTLRREGRPDPAEPYDPKAAYNASKLANAVFGLELHRRLTAAGSAVRSVLAHPGYAATGLQAAVQPGLYRTLLTRVGNPLIAVSPDQGARPILHAATAPDVRSGEFIAPTRFGEMRGAPGVVRPSPAATDPDTARRLWALSEELTGVRFPLPQPAA
ncbi:SDR family NAD(P)-dependent oxidoreductase [Actinoplanes sp. URMC 104]|uniref:SDR family NAD(P)-dependent oxidoreductase n=1 Tax=Actinoplanes sp. URMC 104 TaxID=3423409 RepID=UPI003F1C8BBB